MAFSISFLALCLGIFDFIFHLDDLWKLCPRSSFREYGVAVFVRCPILLPLLVWFSVLSFRGVVSVVVTVPSACLFSYPFLIVAWCTFRFYAIPSTGWNLPHPLGTGSRSLKMGILGNAAISPANFLVI